MAKDIKPRAERNRTLTVSDREIPLLEKCISSLDDLRLEFRDNMIINADIFDVLDNIPDEYFDMIIIDPPYNLDKDFNGKKFSAMKDSSYEDYLRSWFYKVCDKLKKNGVKSKFSTNNFKKIRIPQFSETRFGSFVGLFLVYKL